jgi:hypothetical protein
VLEEEEAEEPVGILMEGEPTEPEGDEFSIEAESFLNEALPMEERIVALKNAIMACQATPYAEEPTEEAPADSTFGALFQKK